MVKPAIKSKFYPHKPTPNPSTEHLEEVSKYYSDSESQGKEKENPGSSASSVDKELQGYDQK